MVFININFPLSGGDWPYFFTKTIHSLPWLPQIWSSYNGNGFGQNVAFVLGYKTLFALLTKLFTEVLHAPWVITEKLIFFIPFWILAVASSYFLSRYFFKNKPFNLLSSLIYTTNTYSLLLVGGGQMGVALAYALTPFVLLSVLFLMDKQNSKRFFSSGLLLGLLLSIDPRAAGITFIISFIFLLFAFSKRKLAFFLSTAILSAVLNSFWIIPFLFSGTGGLSDAYTGTDILYFLSFAKFENAAGLLHPNWPENIFGKVGFMRPEFLVLPILAYSVFLFKTDRKVKVLGLVALLGIFLAKGVNLPFGQIYYVLSDHIPLFTMFRDATKWYLVVAISYSILIPYAIVLFTKYISSVKKFTILDLQNASFAYNLQFTNNFKNIKFLKQILIIVFVIFWCVTIRQLLLGQLTGTFQPKQVPSEYLKLADKLEKQQNFSRVLWVPQQSRFGYFSNDLPAVDTYDIVTSHDVGPTFKFLNNKKTYSWIQDSAISYVIVPFDATHEIYLTDRKYDKKIFLEFMNRMKKIPWLVQDTSFKDIGVFLVKATYPHAFVPNSGVTVSMVQNSLTSYSGKVSKHDKPVTLIFSEQFDPHWVLHTGNVTVFPMKYKNMFNSYSLKPGVTAFTLNYTTQKYVALGVIVSVLAFGMSALFIFKK